MPATHRNARAAARAAARRRWTPGRQQCRQKRTRCEHQEHRRSRRCHRQNAGAPAARCGRRSQVVSVFSSVIVCISFNAAFAVCDLVLFMLMLHGRCDHHHAGHSGGVTILRRRHRMSRLQHRGLSISERRVARAGLQRDGILSKQATAIAMTLQCRLCRSGGVPVSRRRVDGTRAVAKHSGCLPRRSDCAVALAGRARASP